MSDPRGAFPVCTTIFKQTTTMGYSIGYQVLYIGSTGVYNNDVKTLSVDWFFGTAPIGGVTIPYQVNLLMLMGIG